MSIEIMPTEQHMFHVEFELRPMEDRAASIEAGHPVFVDVEFAVITMPGGKLVVDKEITEELLREWKFGNPNKRKPPSPFAISAYDAWKEGRAAPVNGTDLKNWPGVTPAQVKMCHNAAVYSVEDLAAANSEVLRYLGMGGLALVNKAKAYLANATTNKASEEIAALNVRLDALVALTEKQAAEIKALNDELRASNAPKGE